MQAEDFTMDENIYFSKFWGPILNRHVARENGKTIKTKTIFCLVRPSH